MRRQQLAQQGKEMDGVDTEALKQLVLQLATVAQQLERRSELAVSRVDASTAALDQELHALGAGAERFARDALRVVAEEAQEAVGHGVGSTLAAFNRQLEASAQVARAAAGAMEEQRRHLVATGHTLARRAGAALLVGSLLAVCVAGYTGWKAVQQVRRAQFTEDVAHATQSGVLTRCGGTLCVKAAEPLRRYARNPAYVLIAE